MTSDSSRTRAHEPREVRRAQILEAAFQCFSESGYHAASMNDLVRASGLSKGSLYWHFESKEQVFLALFDAFADDYFASWQALDDGQRPLFEVIAGGNELAIRRLLAQPGMMRAWIEFLAHPAARDRLAVLYRRCRELLEDLLERAMERGEMKRLPSAAVSTLLIGAAEGILLQASVDPEFDPLAHWPGVLLALEGGLVA
ncbi:MAG: TetR/AcrR family transcriptional regulator [bacterium]|nr:TetR/AcrR family transcriptional regulator [bacterium]MCP5070072.1 TetR/AcrR family transcriptional regulator [bacterium]